MFEAFRRNDMADSVERRKPLSQRWVGLGSSTAYRPVLETGLMAFHDGKTPPRGCMGWLVLTPKGVELYAELAPELHRRLEDLKKDPDYTNSHISRYQLAGGMRGRP